MPVEPAHTAIDYLTTIGTLAGGLGVVGSAVAGAYLALRYGRKGSAKVEPRLVHSRDGNVYIDCRLSFTAHGLFRIKLASPADCVVQIGEILDAPIDGGGAVPSPIGRKYEARGVFGEEPLTVDAGETQFSSVLVSVDQPDQPIAGWIVVLNVHSGTTRPVAWDDRVFLPYGESR